MAKSHPNKPALTQRLVRVFISSTFRDMQAERDYLVKHVFPELRKRCRERQVEFVEVDLRWGVTEAQANRGEVLPICLAEIENCRPYFIGLLGERYGWVPPAIDPELLQTQEWLGEHREHSITELEILHGVLRNPEMATRAYFYFRDPLYLERLPESQRLDYLSEDPASQAKLRVLKERIRHRGLSIPVRENYPDPETVGTWILKDLWRAIDQEYPPGEEPDPLEREAAEHEAFAASRARVYLGRPEYFNRLDRQVQSEAQPLVILGESGVGKSALLANWVQQYRAKHPEDFVFLHFIGSTPQSTDYVALLYRLISEIKRRTGDPDEVPAQPEKLREDLPLWLAKAAARGRLVLVLDALNQLEDKDNAPDLGWLPEYFPPQVRVILATLPGRSLTALKKRGWPAMEIQGLQTQEIRQVAVAYLGQYRKSLDAPRLDRIVAAPACANPLYLRALLEELRVFGVHEQLDQRLDHYLSAPAVPALYRKILERLEEDFDKPRPGLVREAVSLLWAARRGLYESELLELLGTAGGPLPRAFWSPLALALEESLVSRSGLLGFFHDYLRQAVKERYLPNPEADKAQHLRLAYYFQTRALDDRQVDELPWQLHQASEWEALQSCLTALHMFLKLMTDTRQYELLGYWLTLKGQGHELVKAYQAALPGYPAQAASEYHLAVAFDRLASFFQLYGEYGGALPLFHQTLALREKVLGPEHPEVATSLNNLALLYCAQGRYGEAETLLRQTLALREKVLGPEHPEVATSLNNLAGLYETQGRYGEAEPLHRQSLALREKVLGPEHPYTAQSLNNLALLYCAQGRYNEAEPLYRRSLALWEKVLGPEHPEVATSLNNLAGLYWAQGRYGEAEPLYQRDLAICEKVLGPEHPDVAASLNNRALLYCAQGRYGEAEPLYQRSLTILEKVVGPEHPDVATSLNNLALLYCAQGRYGEAEPLYQRSLALREKVLGPEHPNVANSLNNLAELYRAHGRYAEAEPLYQRSLTILEKVVGPEHPDVAQSLNNLALLYCAQGRYGEAEPLYQRALALGEKALGPEHPDVALSLKNLASLYADQGRYNEAEPLYRRSLALEEKVLGPEHPDVAISLNNLALLYQIQGRYGEAEPLYLRALELFQQLSQPVEAANAELNLQVMFFLSGQPVDLPRIKELTEALNAAGDPRARKGRDLLERLG